MDATTISRKVTLCDAAYVNSVGKDALEGFLRRNNAFCELGVVPPIPNGKFSKEAFDRFCKIDKTQVHVVLSGFQYDETGALVATAKPYIPVKKESIVKALAAEKLKLRFVPRVLTRRRTVDGKVKTYHSVVTFDLAWV